VTGAGHSNRLAATALVVLATLAAAFALKWTSSFSAPFAFALISALVLNPLRAAVAARLPRRLRWVGVAAAVLVLVVAYAALLGAIGLAGAQAARELPKHADSLGRLLSPARSVLERLGAGGGGGGAASLLEEAARVGAGAVAAASGFVVLSVFYVTLMLSEAGRWRRKVQNVLRREEAARVLDAVGASTSRVRRYLLALTLVGLATAGLEAAFLAVAGVPLVLLWALLFFVLNFVPYVGSIVAAVPPIAIALATQGPRRGLLVALGILAIEQVMGNLVAPVVEGRGTKLSPLVVLAAVTFWGWAWGPIGAVLAVPLTAAVMLLSARVPALEPVATLLAEDPEGAA
jgi:predicted PurR-regulated permease PerM